MIQIKRYREVKDEKSPILLYFYQAPVSPPHSFLVMCYALTQIIYHPGVMF